MILYKFYAKSSVFLGGTTWDYSRRILQGFRPNNSKHAKGLAKKLIIRCRSEDQNERLSINEITQHYTKNREKFWPQDVDEEAVENYLKKLRAYY